MSQVLELLKNDPLADHPQAAEVMGDLTILSTMLTCMRASQHVVFDMSLARGLDYYTGVIYEATIASTRTPHVREEIDSPQMGSIAAGGR